MFMFDRHTHMFTYIPVCVLSKATLYARKYPKKVPHRFKLHIGACTQKKFMPTSEIESAIPHMQRPRGEREAGVTQKSLALLPPCGLSASYPGAWEAPLAAVQRETRQMLNHQRHSQFPTFCEPMPAVPLGQHRPRLVLFDLYALPGSPPGVAQPGTPQSLPDDSSVQVSMKDRSLFIHVRLPLMSASLRKQVANACCCQFGSGT